MTFNEIKAAALALDEGERRSLVYTLEDSVGWYPIVTLTAEGFQAGLEGGAWDDLPDDVPLDLIKRACAYVARKADGPGDYLANLEDWVAEVVKERLADEPAVNVGLAPGNVDPA